ncbi:MAG: type II CRISPR RNA-guided endonuclease Cas9, partial [Spirochaetales bacterium]
DFSLEEQDNIVEKLITANEDSEVVQMLEQYDLSESQKKSITKTSFSSGTTSLCKEITEKLIFEMEEKHIQFDKALILLGFNHSDDSTEKYDMLPYYGQVLVGSTMGGSFSADEKNAEKRYGKIGNPTVHVALNQTKVVVNELIKKYGKPTQIIVELSRDLKASKDAKAEIKRQQNKNIKENERLNSNIKDMVKTIAYPNRNDRRKYKLWEELGSGSVTRKCLYCGKPISAHDIFTKDIEIEHILPFSKTFLDNESNLTVAHAHCNAKKGEHSPYEAFGHITSGEYAWNDIMSRVQMLKNYRKQGYFAVDALEKFAGSKGFHERQLQDTRYLSKVARRYLTCLTEKDSNVWAIPGGMTKMLRDTWKIDGILKRKITDQEIVRFELKDDDIGKIHKNRYDHRHHALDAVVIALVDRSLLQEISTRNARKQTHRIEFPEMPFSHSDIIEKVKNIVVSFKPDHGIEGKLSKETLLGVIKREETVNIQDLKKDDISCIENIKIREDFEKMIAEKGSLVKAKTELKNMYPNINIVKEEFVNRTAITGLTEKNIDSIIDAKIKKDLQDFMLQHKDESFEKNLIDFSKETGIKKVRCKVFVQKPIRIKPNPKNPLAVMRYLNPEDYFAVIIWQIPPKKKDGKPSYEGQFIRRTDVDKNKKLKEQTPPHPAAKKMCQLHKDDYIEFSQDGIWKKARIAGFSATNNKLDIFPIFAANTLRDWVISTNEMVAEPGWKPQAGHNHMSINVIFGDLKARKITVSPIGKVHRK